MALQVRRELQGFRSILELLAGADQSRVGDGVRLDAFSLHLLEELQRMVQKLLSTSLAELAINAIKVRILFREELEVCARTGTLEYTLWCQWRQVARKHGDPEMQPLQGGGAWLAS